MNESGDTNLIQSKPSSKTTTANRSGAPTYLRGIVESLSFERVFETPPNDRAREIVCAAFRGIFNEEPRLMGQTKNVVMGDLATAEILIGAHYDSVPGTPGADDNASAVAAMMSIANNIRHTNKLCFVAFNGEECGLAGSTELVHDLPLQHCLKQVHILEMVGYRSFAPNSQKNPLGSLAPDLPTIGDFIGIVSNDQRLVEDAIEFSGAIDVPVIGTCLPVGVPLYIVQQSTPHLLRSDHAPFWEFRIPAVMWADTAEFRNNNYHRPTDTPETLDYAFMAAVADAIIEIIKVA